MNRITSFLALSAIVIAGAFAGTAAQASASNVVLDFTVHNGDASASMIRSSSLPASIERADRSARLHRTGRQRSVEQFRRVLGIGATDRRLRPRIGHVRQRSRSAQQRMHAQHSHHACQRPGVQGALLGHRERNQLHGSGRRDQLGRSVHDDDLHVRLEHVTPPRRLGPAFRPERPRWRASIGVRLNRRCLGEERRRRLLPAGCPGPRRAVDPVEHYRRYVV